MDCSDGRIYEDIERTFDADTFDGWPEVDGKVLAPLSERQFTELKPLGDTQRKGYMRNQPCVCGSKIKFKRCCWAKFA